MVQFESWTGIGAAGLNSMLLARRGREILTKMQQRGILVPAANRLSRAVDALEALNRDRARGVVLNAGDAHKAALLLESFRTVWDALVVTYAAFEGRASSAAITNEHLSAFLEGADLSSNDSNSQARNFQFEAFVAATLVLSGVSIERAEPDFRFTYHGRSVGLAVKRLTSIKENALKARLSDAVAQLQASDLRGFVAVNLDAWITDLPADRTPETVGASFVEQLRGAHRTLGSAARKTSTMGALLFSHYSRWHFDAPEPELEFRVVTRTIGFSEDEEDERRFNEFFRPAEARMTNSWQSVHRLIQ